MRKMALFVSLVLLVSACAGTEAEPTTTATTPAAPVATATPTPDAATPAVNPALEPILGTWFRWTTVSQGSGNQPLHGHTMIEFIDNGLLRTGFRDDPEPLRTTNWAPFTFDGDVLESRLFPRLTQEGCPEEGIYQMVWLSEDHIRLEVLDDDCAPRVQDLSLFTATDGSTYDLTWRRRTQEVRDELADLNRAIRNGGRYTYHPHWEGPRLAAYEG